MPWDDDGDDDAPQLGPLLPPDDRLWRHPSELGDLRPPQPATGGEHSTRVIGIAVVSGLVGAVLTVGIVAAVGGFATTAPPRRAVERIVAQPAVTLTASGDGTAAVIRSVAPAVARVDVTTDGEQQRSGSGVFFRSDGQLVTNAHLLAGARSVAVVLADGSREDAAVVGTDAVTDVGVLKVDRTDVPSVAIATGADPATGSRALAVGAAQDGQPWVRSTSITATARRAVGVDGSTLHGMLQVAPGIDSIASGGALVDSGGALIGLLTEVKTDASDGLGYATPAAVVLDVADDIASTGKAHQVWLGIEGDDVADEQASSMQVSGGVAVSRVVEASPAAVAGLQVGDVITAVDDKPVTTMSELVAALRSHEPGDTVDIRYMRGAERRRCTPTLADRA